MSSPENETCFILPNLEQKNLDNFLKHFLPLVNPRQLYVFTKKPKKVPRNVTQVIVDYYSADYPKMANTVMKSDKREFICHLSDDVRFTKDWLPGMKQWAQRGWVVSAGYCETRDEEVFRKAAAATAENDSVVFGFYGACYFAKKEAFAKVGWLDETIDKQWSDLDLFWRFYKGGVWPVVPRKITMQHFFGLTRRIPQSLRETRAKEKAAKREFIAKHGREAFNAIKAFFITQGRYFSTFKKLTNNKGEQERYLQNLKDKVYAG